MRECGTTVTVRSSLEWHAVRSGRFVAERRTRCIASKKHGPPSDRCVVAQRRLRRRQRLPAFGIARAKPVAASSFTRLDCSHQPDRVPAPRLPRGRCRAMGGCRALPRAHIANEPSEPQSTSSKSSADVPTLPLMFMAFSDPEAHRRSTAPRPGRVCHARLPSRLLLRQPRRPQLG
jgi:hypothetical protein